MMKKRIISFLLTAVLVISACVFPEFGVYAEEKTIVGIRDTIQADMEDNNLYELQDQYLSRTYQIKVEDLAEEIFPEYTMKSNEATMKTLSVAQTSPEWGAVVYSETRTVSDTEKLTYVEYANGRSAYMYQKAWASASERPTLAGRQYTGTLVITVLGCYGSVYVQGLQYTINDYTYDTIDAVGKCVGGNAPFNVLEKQRENASGPARAVYGGNVEDMLFSMTIPVSFSIEVGNNMFRVYDYNGNLI